MFRHKRNSMEELVNQLKELSSVSSVRVNENFYSVRLNTKVLKERRGAFYEVDDFLREKKITANYNIQTNSWEFYSSPEA